MSFFNPIKPYFRSFIRNAYFFVKKYPAQPIIAFLVIILHLIPFIFRHKTKIPVSKNSRKLQVSTYAPAHPRRVPTKTPSPTQREKKTHRSKVSAKLPRDISKNTLHSMQKIYKKLQQIEQSTSSPSSTLLLPKLPKESEEAQREALPYQTLLLDYLEKNIFLPEQGTVDLQITLSDNGKLISITIIHATSKTNADFLCTELEKHIFPPFLKEAKEKTFILSFQSHGM